MDETLLQDSELAALVKEFEGYIASPSAWSNKRMSEYRHRFGEFGIDRTAIASDLIAQAHKRLGRDLLLERIRKDIEWYEAIEGELHEDHQTVVQTLRECLEALS